MLKRKKAIGCDMDIIGRKVVDVKSKVNRLVDELRHNTLESYANVQQNIDRTLSAVGSRLRDMIDRESQGWQRSVHTALGDAASDVRKAFL